jgi:peptidoglycan/LPS O-acetylase OafA/YrhL
MSLFFLILGYFILVYSINFFGKSFLINNIKERNGIDLLRGILAYCVFAGHSVLMKNTFNGSPWWPPQLNDVKINVLAGISVDTFFVITGFLFSNINNYKKINILKFYSRRILRIYPAYIFFCFLIIIYLYLSKEFNLSVLNIFILKTSDIEINYRGLNPALFFHIWSLKLEIIFYLILPVIFYSSNNFFKHSYVLITLLLMVFDIRFVFILLGFVYGQNKLLFNKMLNSSYLLFLVMLIPSFLILDLFYFEMNKYLLYFFRIIVSLSLVILFNNIKISNFSSNFCYLGDFSYSLYLCHGLALVLSYKFLIYLDPSIITKDYFIIISIPILVIFTLISFRLTEFYYFKLRI